MDSHDNKMDDDLFDEIIEFDDGVGGSDDKENQADRKGHKAKKAQMNKMKSFMADHIDVDKHTHLWTKLVQELNDLGPPIFTDSEWKLKWSQHKYNKKRKLMTETAGNSTEVSRVSNAITEHSLEDDAIVDHTATLTEVLKKLVELTKKQDTIIEKLDTTNKLLAIIAETFKK